ncbi:hypothetical protein Hanom_Chr10g00912611 [Helianthus anomalus]|nr:hypothetical protein HanIR_Chr10g0471691 [Helianthus annuus]
MKHSKETRGFSNDSVACTSVSVSGNGGTPPSSVFSSLSTAATGNMSSDFSAELFSVTLRR